MPANKKEDHDHTIAMMIRGVTENFNRDGGFTPHILALMPDGTMPIALLFGDTDSRESQAIIIETMRDFVRSGAESVALVSPVASVCGVPREEMLRLIKDPAALLQHPKREHRVRIVYQTRSKSETFSAPVIRQHGAAPKLGKWTYHPRAASAVEDYAAVFTQVAAEHAPQN